MQDWHDRTVLIVGVARQGIALARYLLRHGARVILNDKRTLGELSEARQSLMDLENSGAGLEWVCGDHPLQLLDKVDLVCVSGGVPLTLPLIQAAQTRGIPLSNDSQIFLDTAPAKVVGITGSAGKTTTTTLVGRIAHAALEGSTPQPYRKAWVGGNIGTPLINLVDEMDIQDLAIMELSSFQLEIMQSSPQIAAVLNATPNHLDRHGTMAHYLAAKERILLFQTNRDAAIFGRDDPNVWSLRSHVQGQVYSFGFQPLPPGEQGTYLSEGQIFMSIAGQADVPVMPVEAISLRGDHNLLNVMAACTIAYAADLPVGAMQAGIAGFGGVAHRLEFVRSWGGANWYNDSMATAPERAMAAIRSFDEPLVLLAGGRDKNLPWAEFAALVRNRVRCLVTFGEAAGIITQALNTAGDGPVEIIHCGGLREAVLAAARHVQPGDVVLLSPGGTSFDEFKDFEERGKCFIQWVNELP